MCARTLSPWRGPGVSNLTVHGLFSVFARRVLAEARGPADAFVAPSAERYALAHSHHVTHSRAQPRVLILPALAPEYAAPKPESLNPKP